MSGGSRLLFTTIGATLDADPAGITNTFSPGGLTADQGEYLFDGWKRSDLVNTLHLLTGITVSRMPEGISGGQQLNTVSDWDTVIKDAKEVLIKEIYSHTKQYWERRAWYHAVTASGGRDEEFNQDIDNLGWVQSNQWLDPLIGIMLTTMYTYQFMTTQVEKNALRAVYNMGAEVLAGYLERIMYATSNTYSSGSNPEGWAYAHQSMENFLLLLDSMKNMGDRRLWDGKAKNGITYSYWINDVWKWDLSRILPNGLIINAGSCDADSYTDVDNRYNIYGRPLTTTSILVSEAPSRGSIYSAQYQTFNMFRKIWGWNGIGIPNLYYYEQKLLAESLPAYGNFKLSDRGYYFPEDQTFVWKSDLVIPAQQFETKGFNYETNKDITLSSKPFVFSVWGKGAGKFDGKAHRDEGHVSAYMGDAVILLESD